jgi:hypothetical protein
MLITLANSQDTGEWCPNENDADCRTYSFIDYTYTDILNDKDEKT